MFLKEKKCVFFNGTFHCIPLWKDIPTQNLENIDQYLPLNVITNHPQYKKMLS